MIKTVNVHIGEIKVSKQGELLKALLGSCIGLGFIWKKNSRCGLAHCLLPKSYKPTFEIGARFIDQGYRSMIALMKIGKNDLKEIDLIIAGGANLFTKDPNEKKLSIGSHNFQQATELAHFYNFNVIHCDVGGIYSRQISINSLDFSFQIETIKGNRELF